MIDEQFDVWMNKIQLNLTNKSEVSGKCLQATFARRCFDRVAICVVFTNSTQSKWSSNQTVGIRTMNTTLVLTVRTFERCNRSELFATPSIDMNCHWELQ